MLRILHFVCMFSLFSANAFAFKIEPILFEELILEESCGLKIDLTPVTNPFKGQMLTPRGLQSLSRTIKKELTMHGFEVKSLRILTAKSMQGKVYAEVKTNLCIGKKARQPHIRHVYLEGNAQVKSAPLTAAVKRFEGKPFDGRMWLAFRTLVQEEYLKKGKPRPYVFFMRHKLAEGVLHISIKEKAVPVTAVTPAATAAP